VQEKADILETNLFKSISRQSDLSRMHIKINRINFPDPVIQKALLQLMPRFNIKPRNFLLGLRDLLQKEIPPDKSEEFKKNIDEEDDALYDDLNITTRSFQAIASRKMLDIIVLGVPDVKSRNGEIAKSFFNHEQSPGKLLKDGIINFKEINRYPIVNAEEKLFYITHEEQGKQGLSFKGKLLLVEEAMPFMINIGSGVEKVDDPDETGKSKGYFLQSKKTGVVTLIRNKEGLITDIDINDEIEIKKLDYSVGNIGSLYTCPIQMKVGVVCNGFKIRVNGKVDATIVDGGEIITNSVANIMKVQSGSTIMALKDITIDSVTHSKIISECGVTTITRELIDSKISSPKVIFEKSKGLITNNKIETENLAFSGLYFSGENIIHFGNNLFVEKEELIKSKECLNEDKTEILNNQKLLMAKLQQELKRLTKLTISNPELIKHIKPLIIATKAMDYETIYKEMDFIQKSNHTKVVANVRKLFEALERIPNSLKACEYRESTHDENIREVNQRMAAMKLTIEGFLRRAATIKIFCGSPNTKKIMAPDFMIESDSSENKIINLTGTYSHRKGFEFVQ